MIRLPPTGRRIGIVGTRKPTPEIELLVCQYVVAMTYEMCGRTGYVIVSGGAPGVDTIAVNVAEQYKLETRVHPPEKYLEPLLPGMEHSQREREIALMRRNGDVVNDSDWVIAFPGTKSIGTWDAVKKAIAAGKLWEVRRGG